MSNADRRKNADWRRHLRGWRPGAVVVGLAVLTASLAVPRPAVPSIVPMPRHDVGEARRTEQLDRERATLATREPLSHGTRLIGETLRRLGAASVSDPRRAQGLQRELAGEVRKHVASGRTEELLRLRALQGELFLRAVRDWERTGDVTDELRELGGDFVERARGWTEPGHAPSGANGRLVLTDTELRLLFRMRWGTLTGTHRLHPFGPTLNELRHYYGTLLEHPPGDGAQDRLLGRLEAVAALGRIDGTYPADFARGVLLYELGDLAGAAQSFQAHARAHGDGPWILLARNHWLAARSQLESP